MRAVLIYQHASQDADCQIADALSERLAPLWPAAPGQQTDVRQADRPARRPAEPTQSARWPADDRRERGGTSRGGL